MSSIPDSAIRRALLLVSGVDAEPAGETALAKEVLNHFDQSRLSLLRYLYSLGLRHSDGEEVVQEVFLALFEHLRRGRGGNNLRGWLFRVAHNIGLESLNAERRCQTLENANLFDRQIDPQPDPEQQLNARQRQATLLAVFQALPEVDRACLALRAEGMTYRDISAALGISLGAVAKSLARSLDRLHRVNERL